MKKLILLFLIMISFANANSSVATKDDIKALRDDIKIIVHQMDKRLEAMEKSIYKRFEQVDKRFAQVDKRFEQVEKRFEQVDKRFEQVNKRFEQVDKRLDQIDKRLEFIEKRMENEFRIMMGTLVAFFVLIMGYLLKERTSIKKDIKEEIEPEFLKKADKTTLEKVISVIEDYARVDEELRKVLERHHLRYMA